MRILLLGAQGLLGRALQHELIKEDLLAWGRQECDITLPASRDRIFEAEPEVVINAAAWTDVDGSEAPDAWSDVVQVNACSLNRIVQACHELGAHFIHISTNEVFPGEPGCFYHEEDPVRPINAYGRSKAMGEQIVKASPQHCIVRVSWLFGPHGEDFPCKIIRAADRLGQLRVVDDEIGRPTYTLDAAQQIAVLAKARAKGIFHVTNKGITSRYLWACHILKHTGREKVIVTPIPHSQWSRPAPTPLHAVLTDNRLRLLGKNEMPAWEDAMQRYLRQASDLHLHP